MLKHSMYLGYMLKQIMVGSKITNVFGLHSQKT